MLRRGIYAGLTTDRQDWGQCAGEELYALGVEPGIDSTQHDIHAEVVHLATLADILVTAARKDKPWLPSESVTLPGGIPWSSDVLLDPSGTELRHVLPVSSWNEQRHYSVCRGWDSLANVCIFEMPLKIGMCIVGPNRNGKRHSYWTHGLQHPVSKQLRFKKKIDPKTPFKSSWIEVWRENYDNISTEEWLNGMIKDSVLSDVCFSVEVPVPERSIRKKIIELAARKLDALDSLKQLPEPNLSTCYFPKKCPFIGPCHSDQPVSGRFGFVRINGSD